MKSKATKEIVIVKGSKLGGLPTYLSVFHRHLEKEKPSDPDKTRRFSVPVDLLRLNFPAGLVDEIAEVDLVYR